MDSSRRAVESYWRSRMIDSATSDEDKVTPVYILDEICDLLRSSHPSIVKEVSEFILKRLDHKSPIVKQKALRLIKYAVGKSGVEFRREMQRHSAVVRPLFHYKGSPDPLKGDALNKAVRDTAHETVSAIFSEENRPAAGPTNDLSKRIQGFGNTNYEMSSSEDKKSFLSEVVGIGSASIKQGISSFTQGHSTKKNDNGSYRSPNLHRSLTIESDDSDRYEPVKLRNESVGSLGSSTNVAGSSWGQDSRTMNTENKIGDSSSSYSESKTPEERLLETVVTSGGVRLQPTRDALQVFLVKASKLDGLALTHALESKLQAPMWQVRMKAVCVLEAILRRKDVEQFVIISSYFSENIDVVIKCSESPQASLREKANKVLALLDGKPADDSIDGSTRLVKVETSSVRMPDLIDTGDSDDFFGTDESLKASDQKVAVVPTPSGPFVDDLLGDGFGPSLSSSNQKKDDDPFADVSFHTDDSREHGDDIFSGMTVDKSGADGNQIPVNQNGAELFDIFVSNSELSQDQQSNKTEVDDLMAGMSISENVSKMKQQLNSPGIFPENIFSKSDNHLNQHVTGDSGKGMFGSQVAGVNVNPMFPTGAMPYNFPPGITLNPAFFSHPINYGAMGNILAQQQLLATMTNFQHLSNLNAQNAPGSQVTGNDIGGYCSPLPDIFQPNYANQAPTSLMNNTKKEDTRAFDFISDHLAAARDPRRVS